MAVAVALLPLAGCDRFRARVEFKRANSDYNDQNYRQAMVAYGRGLELDPTAKQVWRSVGLSALALYRPGDKSPGNIQLARTAVDAFEKYLAAYPDDKKVHDYVLSTLLQADLYDEATKRLRAELVKHPNDLQIHQNLITTLVKANKFEEAKQQLASAGVSAGAVSFYIYGVASWEKAYKDGSVTAEQRPKYIVDGMEALQRASEIDPNMAEPLVYMGLLAREQAKLETDPAKQQALIVQAEGWRTRAQELLKKKKG